jgi:hypothetical protein
VSGSTGFVTIKSLFTSYYSVLVLKPSQSLWVKQAQPFETSCGRCSSPLESKTSFVNRTVPFAKMTRALAGNIQAMEEDNYPELVAVQLMFFACSLICPECMTLG